jgi:hypothetical protein
MYIQTYLYESDAILDANIVCNVAINATPTKVVNIIVIYSYIHPYINT